MIDADNHNSNVNDDNDDDNGAYTVFMIKLMMRIENASTTIPMKINHKQGNNDTKSPLIYNWH